MSFKVSDKHWEIFCSFMENHTDLAVGRLNVASARDTHKKLWERLATELNALGFGERKPDKWQKTWTDFKYNLKRKASARREDMGKTGGGSGKNIHWNVYEERILPLLGKTFHEGLSRHESGVDYLNESRVPDENPTELLPSSPPPPPPSSSMSVTPSAYRSPSVNMPHNNSRQNSTKSTSMESGVSDDHTYLKTPATRKRKRPTDEICEETLIVLKEISNNLPLIANAINRLTDVIDGKFN